MIKVELIQNCVYHASSYVFDYRKEDTKVQEVSNKVGKVLLDSGYFQEIKEEADPNKEQGQTGESGEDKQPEGEKQPPNEGE